MATTTETETFDPAKFDPDGRPVADVMREIRAYLVQAGIEDGTALSDMTWHIPRAGTNKVEGMTVNDKNQALWPTRYRWVLCSAVKGGSEGYYVHIATVENEDRGMPIYRMLGMAKVWDWRTARLIADACSTLFQMNADYARHRLDTKPA